MFYMLTFPISGHNRIMPKLPSLRQLMLTRYGQPFIPGLKSPGISGWISKQLFLG